MPTRDNTQVVHLNVDLTTIFRQRTEEERKRSGVETLEVGTVVNRFIRKALYYEEQMDLAREHIEYLKAVDDTVILLDKDSKQSVMIEVRAPNTLYCETDSTDNCRHIGFAWTIPEVVTKLRDHGFKPPRDMRETA